MSVAPVTNKSSVDRAAQSWPCPSLTAALGSADPHHLQHPGKCWCAAPSQSSAVELTPLLGCRWSSTGNVHGRSHPILLLQYGGVGEGKINSPSLVPCHLHQLDGVAGPEVMKVGKLVLWQQHSGEQALCLSWANSRTGPAGVITGEPDPSGWEQENWPDPCCLLHWVRWLGQCKRAHPSGDNEKLVSWPTKLPLRPRTRPMGYPTPISTSSMNTCLLRV